MAGPLKYFFNFSDSPLDEIILLNVLEENLVLFIKYRLYNCIYLNDTNPF